MTRFLPAALAILLIVAVAMWYHSRRTIADLEREVAQLRAKAEKEARGNAERKATGAKTTPTVAAAGTGAGEKAGAGDTSRDRMEKSGEGSGADLLMGAGKKEIAARSAARVKLLRERLKLRPDQEAALTKAAEGRDAAIAAAFERIRQNKGTPPDLGVMMDWMLGNSNLPVEGLLDAEQTATYAGMEEADRTSRIEGMVSMELLELQSQGGMHLTPEQKDQVFAALSGIVGKEDTLGTAYYEDDGNFMARIDESLAQRREALQGLLDADQAAAYERMLEEDRGQIVTLFGGGTAK